jgi:hypothetical protein
MQSSWPCPAVVSTVQLTRRSTTRRALPMLVPGAAVGFQASLAKKNAAPMATSNSSTYGHPKIPHLTRS